MNDWLEGVKALNRRGEPAVLVTVVKSRGSTPREPGAKMAVGLAEIHDTIGGGQVEHAAIENARFLLEQEGDAAAHQVERHQLSPALGQCCGGVVWLLFERIPGRPCSWIDLLASARADAATVYTAARIGGNGRMVLAGAGDPAGAALPAEAFALVRRAAATGAPVFDRDTGWFIDPVSPPDFQVVLFGAGHVGRALAGVLASLPCSLTWVDSRGDQWPRDTAANVRTVTARKPELVVDECATGSFYLVMTHSHPLDFEICGRILARGDFSYCGLIGSLSKRRSFEKRMRLKGVTEAALNRLTCPIGITGIPGKRPAEIAIAVAAELLQVRGATSMSAGDTEDVPNTG